MHESQIATIRQEYETMLQEVCISIRFNSKPFDTEPHAQQSLRHIESADVAVFGCQKLRHSNWILTFLHRFTFVECHRYENLKGKYYELKRAELNGEQRPQWLYWKEMDYIVNQMPSNKLRTNLDHRISHINNTINTSTLNASAEQTRSATSTAELRDTKPIRLTIQSQDTIGKL